MRFSFTAATERAIAVASDWCSGTRRRGVGARSRYWWGCCRNRSAARPSCWQKHGIDIPAVSRNGRRSPPLLKSRIPLSAGHCRLPLPPARSLTESHFPPRSKIRSKSPAPRLDFLPRPVGIGYRASPIRLGGGGSRGGRLAAAARTRSRRRRSGDPWPLWIRVAGRIR